MHIKRYFIHIYSYFVKAIKLEVYLENVSAKRDNPSGVLLAMAKVLYYKPFQSLYAEVSYASIEFLN